MFTSGFQKVAEFDHNNQGLEFKNADTNNTSGNVGPGGQAPEGLERYEPIGASPATVGKGKQKKMTPVQVAQFFMMKGASADTRPNFPDGGTGTADGLVDGLKYETSTPGMEQGWQEDRPPTDSAKKKKILAVAAAATALGGTYGAYKFHKRNRFTGATSKDGALMRKVKGALYGHSDAAPVKKYRFQQSVKPDSPDFGHVSSGSAPMKSINDRDKKYKLTREAIEAKRSGAGKKYYREYHPNIFDSHRRQMPVFTHVEWDKKPSARAAAKHMNKRKDRLFAASLRQSEE